MPEPRDTHRIIVPGSSSSEPPSGGSRIIRPPGAVEETTEDLPDPPRLRPLVLVPISEGGRELILISDPLGVIENQPVLSIEALPLLQLLDGSVRLNDITAAVARESKDLRVAGMVREFVAQLDRMLLLDSPRFEAAYRERRETYHALEIRPAALEDRSYPGQPENLTEFLNGHFAEAEGWRAAASEPVAAAQALPRALLAPHLDPRRAGATIARAYLELGPTPAEPLRVVVFGTGHSLLGDPYALTRKHFETPLGKVSCDLAFVDELAGRLGEGAYHGELAHREEHSIEFQAVYLAHRLGNRPFKMVPILCGGFHALLDQGKTPRDDPDFEAMITAVRETERAQGGTTLYVAGVDLSHVGPRFGDPALDDATRGEIEAHDREVVERARLADADGWFATIAAREDDTRICAFAPTYAMLRCAEPREGRLLRYEQSPEPDGSMVSVASLVWP